MRCVWLFAVVLAACGDGVLGGDALRGRISVRSDLHGEWTMTPTACFSGERQLFFGVDLSENGDGGTLVRLVLDPLEGYRLAMNVPGQDIALVVDEPEGFCEVFDVHVGRTNTRVNEIWSVEGFAFITCRGPDLEIDADLEFSGCH